jgi:hypothetical protein
MMTVLNLKLQIMNTQSRFGKISTMPEENMSENVKELLLHVVRSIKAAVATEVEKLNSNF